MADILRLEDIHKTYPGAQPVRVLTGIDLAIAPGEVVALVAPSGSGKSTLLHIAGLLDTPDRGRVIVNGQDMTGQPDRARTIARRRMLGFVYQFHHLLPEFSALENVILPQLADGRAMAPARAQALLRDAETEAALSEMLRNDDILRDAVHHFLRQYDRMLGREVSRLDDAQLVALSDTRSGRAFMLLGRVSGSFG